MHFEVVLSLSTQTCLSVIRRLVVRRGSTATFCSDNGINFVGADNLLREQLFTIEKYCATTFTNSGSSRCSYGSIMGALLEVTQGGNFKVDRILHTPVTKFWTNVLDAKFIVNSNPLAYVLQDRGNLEELSRNHFLLCRT